MSARINGVNGLLLAMKNLTGRGRKTARKRQRESNAKNGQERFESFHVVTIGV